MLSRCATYHSPSFLFKNGFLYCENRRVDHVKTWLEKDDIFSSTPFFLYSKAQLEENVNSYLDPLKQLNRRSSLNYAVKANMNPNIVTLMRDLGCSLTLVSGFELQMALQLGFDMDHVVLNGNGKLVWEMELAIASGCLLNIDSVFNLKQTQDVCRRLDKGVRVLLRINPDLDPNVHHYISTGKSGSKFGIEPNDLQGIVEQIRGDPHIQLVGLHCHIGSTISDISVFTTSAKAMLHLYQQLKKDGFDGMQYINLGGGLGIPYSEHASKTQQSPIAIARSSIKAEVPTPAEVVKAIEAILKDEHVTLILEPGRSLVGNAGVLVSSVLGVKCGPHNNYIVVDGSMTEVLRPALYGSYHHTDLAEPSNITQEKHRMYQIVGPVCESADFLGKDRYLATPHVGCCLAVFDVGAYCSSMSTNYNMRPRPAEVLVDGEHCELIRTPDTFKTIMAPYIHNSF